MSQYNLYFPSWVPSAAGAPCQRTGNDNVGLALVMLDPHRMETQRKGLATKGEASEEKAACLRIIL